MDTDQDTTDDIDTSADGDWFAEQLDLITLEDGFES